MPELGSRSFGGYCFTGILEESSVTPPAVRSILKLSPSVPSVSINGADVLWGPGGSRLGSGCGARMYLEREGVPVSAVGWAGADMTQPTVGMRHSR